MRDLKFRHYDGKYMQYSDEHPSLVDYFKWFEEFEKEELLFTGLFDKNKKPIYEGDIMVLNKFKPSYYVVKYIENNFPTTTTYYEEYLIHKSLHRFCQKVL